MQPTESLAPSSTSAQSLTISQQLQRAALPLAVAEPAAKLSAQDDRRYVDERSRVGYLRGKHRFRCVAVVPSCRVLPLPCGVVLTRGINEFTAFSDEVEAIRELLVADEAEQHRQELALAEHLREMGKLIRKRLIDASDSGEARWGEIGASTVVEMIKNDDPDAEFQSAMRYVSETTGVSPSSAYHRMFADDGGHFGMKPILRLDVVEDLGLPDTTVAADHDALAKTIAGTLGQGSVVTPEAIAAAVVAGIREAGLVGKAGK